VTARVVRSAAARAEAAAATAEGLRVERPAGILEEAKEAARLEARVESPALVAPPQGKVKS